MRRPMLLGAAFALLVGMGVTSQGAWSFEHGRQGGTWEHLNWSGVTLSITAPVIMHIEHVRGPGDVVIEAHPNSWYYEPEYRTAGTVQLQGFPNGWGGFETCVYSIHTSERDTTAEVRFDDNPNALH